MTRPTIDVVIPAYNASHTLGASLDSVLAQTVPPDRILVVDDASPSDPAPGLGPYGNRVTLIRREHNGGPGAARNTGIRAASADLIGLLDANDVWDSTLLERQLAAFERHPEIGFCFAALVDCDDALRPVRPPRSVRSREGEDFFDTLYLEGFAVPPTTTVLSREAALATGLYNETLRVGEDLEFVLRILLRYPASSLPDCLAHKRGHPDALTRTTDVASHLEYQRILWEGVGHAARESGRPLPLPVEDRIALTRKRRLRECALDGDPVEAAAYHAALRESGAFTPIDALRLAGWRAQRGLRDVARALLGRRAPTA